MAIGIPLMLGLSGLSALSGIFGNRPKTYRTSESGTSSSGFDSTSSRLLTPQQQAAMELLGGLMEQYVGNPQAYIEPIRMAQREAVNQNFAGADTTLRERYARGAGGASGKFGTAARQVDLARRSALTGVDTDALMKILDIQQGGAGIAQYLLGQTFGTTTSGTENRQYSSSGTSNQPGNMLGGGLSGGLGTLSSLIGLNKILGGW